MSPKQFDIHLGGRYRDIPFNDKEEWVAFVSTYITSFLFYKIILLLFYFQVNRVKNDNNNHTIIFNGQTLQAARTATRGVEA